MKTIKLTKSYTMSKPELDEILLKVADGLEKELKCKSDWQGDVISFQRSGLKGTLSIKEGELELYIKLGLLAASFSGVIKSHVVKYMDEMIY